MKKFLLTIAAFTAFTAAAQQPARDRAFWGDAAEGMSRALVKHFWAPGFAGYENRLYFNYASDLADLSTIHYWPQAHAMDVVVDAYKRSDSRDWLELYPLWWRGIPEINRIQNPEAPLWWNAYVDDMEWIVLAQLRMWETAREQEYFATARRIYDDWIWPTWGPENEDPWRGGITWKVDVSKSKNACSNGPAAIAAACIYKFWPEAEAAEAAVPGGAKGKPREAYLGEALKIYGWLRANLFRPADGGVSDNMNIRGRVNPMVYTYNQGTFIGAAVELYNILGERQYIADAVRAADYVIREMSRGEGGVLSDSTGGDGGLFHGIFFRYFVRLINLPDLDPADKVRFREWLTRQADTMYDRGLDRSTMLWGGEWHRSPAPSSPVALTSHLSGCMLMEAMYVME